MTKPHGAPFPFVQVNRMAKSIDLAVKQQPHMDSGMPHVIRGMFHLNVPPPLKSVPKARESFHRALKVRTSTAQGHRTSTSPA